MATVSWHTGQRVTNVLYNSANSVTLGDVDSDGDLDLVVGNNGQTNRLYLNKRAPRIALPATTELRFSEAIGTQPG